VPSCSFFGETGALPGTSSRRPFSPHLIEDAIEKKEKLMRRDFVEKAAMAGAAVMLTSPASLFAA
jgi:hypothetical protein